MTTEVKYIHQNLIAALKAGSHSAFADLYNIYADLLYGFTLKLTKSPTLSQDILQETFMKIWLSRENISLDKSFKSYLYTIARNLIIDTMRKQANSVSFEEYIVQNPEKHKVDNNVEALISYDEFEAKLKKAKGKFTENQILIFELHKEQGVAISDIAQRLNLSEKTIQNQLSIMMNIMRKEISFLLLSFFFIDM